MSDVLAIAEEWYEFPCSLVQERYWAGEQLARGSSALNIALRWRLVGPIDAGKVTQALQSLTQRHEILRTTFEERDGRPIQKILPAVDIHVPVVDLRLMGKAAREKEFERISIEEARRPFDLGEASLLRVQFLRMDEHEAFLLITAHHIIADGWSMGIIARELCALCNGAITGETPTFAALPIQYSDYAIWQSEWLQSEDAAAEEAYWRAQLDDFRHFEIAADHENPKSSTAGAKITSVLLPPALTAAIEALARREGFTWFSTMLTGLTLVLARRAGKADVVMGTQAAGRDQPELEAVIGPFTNTMLLRCDLTGIATFVEALGRVSETVYGAIGHSHTPLECIQDMLRSRRAAGRRPLFSVNVLQQRAFDEVRCSKLLLQGIPSISTGVTFDLNFFFVERTEGWRFSCEYDTGRFDDATVVGMLNEGLRILEEATIDPRAPLLGFPLPADRPEPIEPAPERGAPSPRISHRKGSSPAERQMLALWKEVLNIDEATASAGFFDLGGSSLDALRLLARIEKVFGQRLGLDVFLKNPSASDLASLLGEQVLLKTPGATTIVLQENGDRTPVFAFHNTFVFQGLAKNLGPERPFYAVVPAGEIYDEADISYRELVAHYVDGIRRVRPHGPYILLGHCFAGRLAYEAAQQLREAGETVECLVVIDGWAPGHLRRKSRLRAFLTHGSFALIRLIDRVKKFGTGQFTLGRIAFKTRLKLGLSEPLYQEEVTRVTWADAKLGHHQIRPYEGLVLVIRALGEPNGLFLEKDLAWGELVTGQLVVRDAPGDHFAIFQEPEVGRLANAIREVIATAAR